MKPKKLDAEALLRQLAEIRQAIPMLHPAEPRPTHDGRPSAIDGLPLRTAEDFEYAAVIEGLESLARDVQASVDHAAAEATRKALDIYYAAEELARDPEHADLIPHVQKMREAYERDFGKPIPPKPRG